MTDDLQILADICDQQVTIMIMYLLNNGSSLTCSHLQTYKSIVEQIIKFNLILDNWCCSELQ